MRKIRKIIELHAQGSFSGRMISAAVGVSRPIVAHYISLFERSGLTLEEVAGISDSELEARLCPSPGAPDPRYQALATELPAMVKQLGRHGVTRQLLWEEYRDSHAEPYSYTQFCFHLQAYAETSELSMHLEHRGGEKLFVDFAGNKPQLTDPKTGAQRACELFVAVFPAGALIYCKAVESQAAEQVVAAVQHTLYYAGGAPQIIVPDNLKAGVTKPDRYEAQINETFQDFASYFGSVVIPARVRRPRDKALVEAAVNLVYQRVLAPLRKHTFSTVDELNEAMAEKLEALNRRPMQRIGICRWERFRSIDLPQLKALPEKPYQLRRFHQATVGFNYHLYFSPDKHYYSVPWTYRKKKVRIVSNELSVEIYHNHQRIASHRRDRQPGSYSTHPEHMPAHHRAYAEWSPQRFLSWAVKIGPQTKELVAAVLESRPVAEQAFRSCMGIIKLTERYETGRLEAAARRALAYRVLTYHGVRSILEKGLDRQAQPDMLTAQLPEHQNIRGEQYYAVGSGARR